MKVGDIFKETELDAYVQYANENSLIIDFVKHIEQKNENGLIEGYDLFQLLAPPEPTEEEIKKRLRWIRSRLLEAFDKWEKAVLRGREQDSEEVMTWYQNILDLNEDAINNVPMAVEYYIDKTRK